ncbi:MAG: hypothetical protein HOW73_26930 [Polyangiaceae bacterium]|nr:hypothetical protein [Polyangiaceae bacterium]
MTRLIANAPAALALSLVCMAAACDPQTGDAYKGEPLATLEGKIQVADDATPPDEAAVAAIVWHTFYENDGEATSEAVDVGGTFPADFTLQLFEPPPPEAFNEWSEGSGDPHLFAIGYIGVLPQSALALTDQQAVWEVAYGVESNFMITYADEFVAEEQTEGVFPGGVQPGYQLWSVVYVDNSAAEACWEPFNECIEPCGEEQACFDACFAAHDPTGCPEFAEGHDTFEPADIEAEQLSIVLGGEIELPNWF